MVDLINDTQQDPKHKGSFARNGQIAVHMLKAALHYVGTHVVLVFRWFMRGVPWHKMSSTREELPEKAPEAKTPITVRLEELESLPHRNAALHWGAFALSLLSFSLLLTWVLSPQGKVPGVWVLLDIGLGVIFAVDFFTRSGFHWGHAAYVRSHFFDFIAIVPALALVNHGFVIEGVWVWIILIARTARVVDRFLGDGFIQRNVLALVAGFEEEITDRVLERIIARIQGDMDRAGFSHGVAAAFVRNKGAVLQRVRAATPREGLLPGLAHIVGLDAALERTEERAYDAIVEIVNSEEVDLAIRDVVNSSFSRMLNEMGKKSWRQHLGIQRQQISVRTADPQGLNQETRT